MAASPPPAAFASYCGTAPIEIASAGRARHRLSCSGDRQLNAVLHTIAVIQIRMRHTAGRAYYDRKIAEGKTPKEAKRRLTDHIWRVMQSDERRRARTGPGGLRCPGFDDVLQASHDLGWQGGE
ncbi:transposase [Actinomadura sp. 3N508]|uniref:transposase n=1 Tax=Actinomadura sp. 3N508 TaxID=3375153 RepID=UPI0037938EE7